MEQVIDRLERVSVPTIAQVQGVAAGGGCLIALACDLRVCSPAARFGVPIARTLGNCLSAANCARLVDLIGPARTKEMLFTGRLLDAAEAASLGLVTRMAEPDAIDDVVRDLAATRLPHNAPLTIRATKEVVRRIALRRRLDESRPPMTSRRRVMGAGFSRRSGGVSREAAAVDSPDAEPEPRRSFAASSAQPSPH